MSETDVSDTPILIKEDAVGVSEGRSIVAETRYIPPLDGHDDLYAEFDLQIARGIYELLTKVYFGYDWKTFADSQQGIVGFQIPALMGPTLHYVVNLKQFSDLTPDLIINRGGELLERMHLPRHKFDMLALIEAQKNKAEFEFGKVQ